MTRTIATALLVTSLLGCGRVNPRPAFADSAAIIHDRTGSDVQWARSAEETAKLEEKVRQLLQKPLTVESVVRIAIWNNRSLQAHFEEIGIAQANAAQAGLPSNPEFGLSFRFPDRPASASNLEIGIALNLLDFLILPRRKKIALVELEQAKLQVAAKALDLVAEVKQAYYILQADLQLIHRLQLILEVNEAAAELARKQREAGTMNDLDLANHVAVYSQSKIDITFAQVQSRVDREKLNRLLGRWGDATTWTIVEELPPLPETKVDLKGLESLAMLQRPELQISRLAVDLISQALALKKGTRFFPVGIQVGVNTERETDRTFVTGPTLVFQLPIFDFGKASIARLQSQQFQAQRRRKAMAVNARSEVRELRDLVLANRELTEFYRQVLLPQRVEILDMTLRHYNMMLKGAYDLLLAKANEVATERAYIEAWRGYWLSLTMLERALGGQFSPHQREPTQAPPSPPSPQDVLPQDSENRAHQKESK